ncbi:uridine kinase [Marchantia polymorpha subsp. ruderalis]|uniref:AAA+ ATPase domain-containing protein n=2 Tax=Marchantia polymorpha TaxID=3197 RepID=A0AAF6B8T9_MARPO|nr:hypothetical protein MARPO_0011s0131 [Marchantia polymorpha]BBN08423.1 hypothetical protein Mp_4g11460 [Marchantia polymorpha subsp. ruderalis]|eukprot:PTQ46459.1 hypothetical protein MARPO_0011s0131 [Marchantia polymorpha]
MDNPLLHHAPPSPPHDSTPPESVLDSFPLHVSFDHGYFMTVRAIQELREKKKGSVSVGIGGPSGSGKSSLATKIASVLGGALIPMENYYDPSLSTDDGNDFDSMDFQLLLQNLEDLMKGNSIMMPQFDFQEKRRAGFKPVKAPKSGVVLVEGTYALHSKLRLSLDLCVAVVGGVHFNLLSKVRRDIGESLSLDYLIDSIFPMFRKHIEPDLHHAQIKVSNSFASLSLREPSYIMKCDKETLKTPVEILFKSTEVRHEKYIEMYLRPPLSVETVKTSDWIRMRQCGIKYDLAEGDQRIVDKHFIIKPRVEFEVGKTTLGGLLALGYQVAVSYKRESTIIDNGKVLISIEVIDDLERTFVQVKGSDRKVVACEAELMGMDGPWITKSYMEMVLETKGLPRLDSPPLPLSTSIFTRASSGQAVDSLKDRNIISPQPLRLKPSPSINTVDTSDTWTRSPTKSEDEPIVGSWHVTNEADAEEVMSAKTIDRLWTGAIFTADSDKPPSTSGIDRQILMGSRDTIKLLPMADTFDFDRGLLLAVQAVQTLLNAKGPIVVVGIGGPSGSGKTSFARKMANIVGCEMISMESYYKADKVKDSIYDDFSCLDLPLLLRNIEDIKRLRPTMIPSFDFEKNTRTGSVKLEVSEDCGVVLVEGVYALHPDIRPSLDICIAVVGGVHSHLVERVQRDLELNGDSLSQQEIMTTLFPMFERHIEPHLEHAHLKISNDFDPVHSPQNSMFVLKSSKQVTYEEILEVLDQERMSKTIQTFTDIYFHLPGLPSDGICTESNSIRVRNCEGRFALLIREPLREGDFIIQPRVDFDISVRTVAGLLTLGYQAVACIEATARTYQDDKLLVEVDHLKNIETPYIQIKGSKKEAVAAAGQKLNLEGTYTTTAYIEIIIGNNFAPDQNIGMRDTQAARLQEIVEFVQAQGALAGSASLVSPVLSIECKVEALEMRLRRLENWQLINTVLWTFFMSAFAGYMLYQRSQRTHS